MSYKSVLRSEVNVGKQKWIEMIFLRFLWESENG